jgi:hypothetical protein
MKLIVIGLFTGGIMRSIFGMSAANSTSLNVSRLWSGLLVGGIMLLIAVIIAAWLRMRYHEEIF